MTHVTSPRENLLYKQGPSLSPLCWDAQISRAAKMVEDQPFKCPYCGEQFSKREGFQRKKHLLTEHQVELCWRCPQCQYKTQSRRYHDHLKHWRARHFGDQEPPVAELEPVVQAATRRSRSRSPRPSSSRSRSPGERDSRRQSTRSRSRREDGRGRRGRPTRHEQHGTPERRRRQPRARRLPPSPAATVSSPAAVASPAAAVSTPPASASSPGGEQRGREPRGSPSSRSPPAAAARSAAGVERPPVSTVPQVEEAAKSPRAETSAEPADSAAVSTSEGMAVVAEAPAVPSEPSPQPPPQEERQPEPGTSAEPQPSTSAVSQARAVAESVAAFPAPGILVSREEDTLAIDLHPVYGEMSFEEEVTIVQPEAPISYNQVRTWFRYQASPEEQAQILAEFGEERRPRVRTYNRRTQANFRPLVRDRSTQVEVRPQVTQLPSGGISVEGPNFAFRYEGPTTQGQLHLQE